MLSAVTSFLDIATFPKDIVFHCFFRIELAIKPIRVYLFFSLLS